MQTPSKKNQMFSLNISKKAFSNGNSYLIKQKDFGNTTSYAIYLMFKELMHNINKFQVDFREFNYNRLFYILTL